jgi:DNA-binding transcriptional LysR family regulator
MKCAMNIRHLSVRQLQVFVAAVRSGNLSATARELHLTQPTVSLQIKRLADVLGEKLLEQREGRLVPTDAGYALHAAASDVLTRLEELSSSLDRVRTGEAGHISIGIVTTAKYVVPRILGAFARVYPKVQITLNIGNRAHVLQRFLQQADDAYLFSHPPTGEHVSATRIIKNPLQIIAPTDHWAAGRSDLRFEDLLTERFLIREPGSATRLRFEAWLSQEGHALHNTMQIESNEAIRLSVASGLGLSVISEHTLQEGREHYAVLAVEGFPLPSHWYIVLHEGRRLPHAAQRLMQFISEHLQDCIRPDWIAEAYTPGEPLLKPPEKA